MIGPREILNYIRDNGVARGVTESDCYYIVKYFDSDLDGFLHYADFMQMLLPCTNSRLRAMATQRPNLYCRPGDYMSLDVEKELAELFLLEVFLHRTTEDLRQELYSMKDFDEDVAWGMIDDVGTGFAEIKHFDRFFNGLRMRTTEEDRFAMIRRLEMDGDHRIDKGEFLDFIRPFEPFSKMLTRNRCAARTGDRIPIKEILENREKKATSQSNNCRRKA